ncbi:MAG: hypothetical protein PUB51_00540 [Oscillospiraceae bacterium]|nr:hypothetical protein [Oscillospiraceae bacterium]
MRERVSRLLTVKSIVTLALTGVFAHLTVTGKLDQSFLTVYTVIISFYFGTQAEKHTGREENGNG